MYDNRSGNIRKAIETVGLTTLSDRLNISKQSITNWYEQGIPLKYILEVCYAYKEITGIKIYPEDLNSRFDGFKEYYKIKG